MDFSQILYDFFAKRIVEQGLYGPAEYLVYGAIMLFLAFFVIFPLLDRRGIKFNDRFFLALLPYILFGSALRVLEDMEFLPRSWNPLEMAYYFVTPGIYLLIAVATIGCLLLAKKISKKFGISFHKTFGGIGALLAVPVVLFELMHFQAWLGVFAVLALVAAIVVVLIFTFKKLNWVILQDNLNRLAIASQVMDGSATFVATQFFRCGEQHPLSSFFLDLFPLSFIFVKIALVLVILHYVDTNIKNKNLAGFIKIVVATLGFATGLRDLLTLGVGTCL